MAILLGVAACGWVAGLSCGSGDGGGGGTTTSSSGSGSSCSEGKAGDACEWDDDCCSDSCDMTDLVCN